MPIPASSTFRIALTAACLTLGACRESHTTEVLPADDTANDIARIDITRNRYVAGDSMSATMVSRTDMPIGYNHCYMQLERVENGAWRRLESDGAPACFAYVASLEPGTRAQMPYFLPRTLSKGTYRLLLEVSRGNVRMAYRVVSGGFTVDTR